MYFWNRGQIGISFKELLSFLLFLCYLIFSNLYMCERLSESCAFASFDRVHC